MTNVLDRRIASISSMWWNKELVSNKVTELQYVISDQNTTPAF